MNLRVDNLKSKSTSCLYFTFYYFKKLVHDYDLDIKELILIPK